MILVALCYKLTTIQYNGNKASLPCVTGEENRSLCSLTLILAFKMFLRALETIIWRQNVPPTPASTLPHSGQGKIKHDQTLGNYHQYLYLWKEFQAWWYSRFESMSFVVNILACKLKIVNNRN